MLKSMPSLRIDDVPEYVLERLKRRAEHLGLSLEVYIWTLLVKAAETTSETAEELSDEWFEKVKSREPVKLTTEEILEAIRRGRE